MGNHIRKHCINHYKSINLAFAIALFDSWRVNIMASLENLMEWSQGSLFVVENPWSWCFWTIMFSFLAQVTHRGHRQNTGWVSSSKITELSTAHLWILWHVCWPIKILTFSKAIPWRCLPEGNIANESSLACRKSAKALVLISQTVHTPSWNTAEVQRQSCCWIPAEPVSTAAARNQQGCTT